MTEDEAKRIQDCMDKPEFLGLFQDYVKDISDPKNMEEYDQYIRCAPEREISNLDLCGVFGQHIPKAPVSTADLIFAKEMWAVGIQCTCLC